MNRTRQTVLPRLAADIRPGEPAVMRRLATILVVLAVLTVAAGCQQRRGDNPFTYTTSPRTTTLGEATTPW